MIRKAIGVVSALVLVLTGAGWWQVYRAVGGITVSDALGALGVTAHSTGGGSVRKCTGIQVISLFPSGPVQGWAARPAPHAACMCNCKVHHT